MAKAKDKEPVKIEAAEVGPVPPAVTEVAGGITTAGDVAEETKKVLDAANESAKLAEENATLRSGLEECKRLYQAEKGRADKLEADAKTVAGAHQERVKRLEDEIERLRGHLTKLSTEYEKLAKAPPPKPSEPGKKVATKRARVTIPGTHVGAIECEFPADADDKRAAAIEAAKVARGIVSFGVDPKVEFLD